MRRKITKAKVTRIALVPRGANRLPVLYKEDAGKPGSGVVIFDPLSKLDEERGELLNVVYAPLLTDSQGDFMTAPAIRAMSHGFMKDYQAGAGIDLRHGEQPLTKEQVGLAESFIIQKGDARFKDFTDYAGNRVDVTDGWATIFKIDDPKLRDLYKSGGWNGVSLFAPQFEYELVKDMGEVPGVGAGTHACPSPGHPCPNAGQADPDGDDDMTKEEITALVKQLLDAALTKPATPPAAPAPAAKIDLTNPAAVKAHLVVLKKAKLAETVDASDPVALEAHLIRLEKELEATKLSETPEEKLARLEKENVALTQQVRQFHGASLQPLDDPQLSRAPGIAKEADLVKAGSRIAAAANKRFGTNGTATK